DIIITAAPVPAAFTVWIPMLVLTTVIGEVALLTPFTVTVNVPVPSGVLEGSSATTFVADTDEMRTSVTFPPMVTCAETPASAAESGAPVDDTASAGP